MRINPINRVYEAYRSQSAAPVSKTSTLSGKDQVELSHTAKEFSSAYKMALEVPDIRQDKVERLKAQISSGTYNVKSEEVAQKMMSQLDIKG